MKKKFVRLISAVLSAAMTLTAVPLSAFAEGEAHTHDGESNVITTPLDFREKTADESGDGWSWDYDTKTLTLNGVNIQATTEENMMSVVTVPDGTKIVLNGENTIVQTDTLESDTYVLSAVNNKEVNCDGTMTISGDGVLNAENRSTDSMARSLGGSIILNGGTVNATGTVKTNSLEIHNDGVLNANATTASFEGVAVNVSGGITVDGNGSLTAVGCANESTLNSAILLTSNFGDKISVSENGSITVPEGNAARVGIYYSGNNGDGMDAEISGGKVTAYGAKYGIYKVNLIMSGTGSVYTTGGSYAIGQTVPTIDEDEFVVKGSTESKASESAVTGEVKLNGGYYEIDGADAKTVVIKPDTSPRIILGKQTGIFKTEEYEIIEGETDIKLKGTVYFDITLKNMSDEEFADARGCFGGDEPDLSASIIKTDYGWVCMVCDTKFSVTYDTDNTLTIKCGDIVSNTVQVKSNANRFNKVTQGDNTNRTVFYTNTSQEEKDNYKLVSTYTVDSESISYNWYSTNSAYSADELGAAVSGSNGEFKLADNIPAGNYVLYCDITYSDGDSTETVTEKFTFTYKECAHENGYSDGKCTNCGALCDHSNIDINTGKCNKCEHQFVATISTDGSAPTGYDTLADCLNSITADTGNYVKIYQDIGDASATAILDTIDVKHNVMIDLNGHKLNNIKLGVNKLGVNKDVTLTLTGTAGSYVTQVYVRKGGGSFIIDSEANVEFNTIFVEDSAQLAVSDGAKVTTEQLTVIASVNDDGTTTTSVKLATGMKLGGLTYHRQNNSGALKLGNLLDVTRQALRREDNGNYLDLYKEYGSMGYSVALTVVEHTDADHKYSDGTGKCEECGKPCEHGGDINTDTGICSICGAVVSVALYTDKNGSLKYVDTDELHSLLNEYNGSGTIKLFKDYSKPSAQYDLYGELTIDLNGRRLNIRSITPCKNGKLTIKNSGNPVMLGCNVYPTNDASYAGGTLIIDGDVVLDTSIYVYDSSTVILKAGAYQAGLYARDSKTLYDMLGEGKAFFKTDGTLFNASVKEISSSVTLIVKDHSHTYVDGKCECGYVCPHSDVDIDTGKCTECEYQYAAVIVKDGAVASVYKETEMGAAFEAADSDANTGCTLKVYKNYTGSYTTLSGKFTLWIAEKANVGTLTVSGDITVTGSGKNNSIYGDFNVADGGKLTFDENCGAMGTVSVGAGTFDCYYSLGITLNINDASSDVILHGGIFRKICYNGGGDRANAEILTLLAENRMFMKYPNAEPIDGSKTLLKDGLATVFVTSHEGHSYDSTTGKCTICGKRCGHTDVDSKTGVCSTCKYQFTAGISGVGTAKYFDNIDNAFTAALSEVNSGCTLTLYKDCTLSNSVTITNATVTLDVNGHSILLAYRIKVNDGGVLYLKNSRENGSIDTEIEVNKGGTLINGTADDSRSAVSVFGVTADAAKRVEIYGGSYEGLTVNNGTSGIALYGGSYESINTNDLTDSTPVSALLAKGYAFATLNSVTHLPESIVDGSAVTLSEGIRNVTVVKHTDADHKYSSGTGKCDCGYVCPHSDVDSKTGVCLTCKYQLTAGISSAGTAKYFDNIDDAFTAALSAENNGCTLTLYKDCELSQNIVIGNATLTVDVNGHSISPEIRGIDVNDGGVLYLKNSGENGSIGLEMAVNKGGTLINGTADDSSSAVSLFAVTADAAECVEFYGGSCTYLTIKNGTSGIALYGGYYDIICGSLTDNTPVNDLLAKGYAFATLNSVTHLPESIVDGSAKTIGDGLKNVIVVAHEHRYNVETGKCPCGVCALAIFTETTQSSETYTFIESETQFKNIAENEADGVLKLTGDVDCIVKGIIINGNKTIDMNGHTLNVSVGTEEISAVAVYGNVTFENSGSSRAVINATGVYSYGMVTVNGDIEFDTFATFEDGDALINAGVFKSIYVQGRSVIEILGSGKALASESGEILNASVQQIYKAGDNIFVTAHPKHTYDDHGNCACGYKCLHDGEGQVNEDSANKVCSECGAKIYAKVTTADGKVKYFDDITEGLRYADKAENKGCVFTLVTSGKINSGVTLSNGQFTITTSNYGTIYDYNQTITIDGADVIAEGYMFIKCKVNVKSGSLTLPEGSSAGFDSIAISGGTVTVSEGVNVDNTAGADNLFVSEDAIDAKLTIGGGTYGRIVLGQFKLKDVIASGVRVISYDNPTDPTAEKTAKALLYSDIAEKNNFDSENKTVSYYLFTKCEHKNEDGSYAFNEGGICKYCNSEFAASVSYTVDGSAKTELFTDIYDAFDKANKVGTATVTLYKDITDKCTQEITVMGNVTLELNGKTLGGRYGIARISVSDGGTLTVNGDGDMDTPIYVNENSKLVINGGGYFNSVSVKKGGNAEIGGGTIQGLSVRGNVKLSGGKFNDIEIFNGNLESVLADGYAYKVEDGTWLSIAERAESVYSSLNNNDKPLSVEEAPIKSASIVWVGEEAPVIYRNGEKYLYVDITYELAVGSRGATYSDFVNGNNRIKDYNLYNKYMVHCYEIGKLAAKDGEVEYYIVLKCNGYEYKSNVLKLTLATCSHPKDSFSYENDGFVICGICDALIEAEVVDADGKSLGYADIESAIKLAQENEGSTVKLMSEGVSESVTVTGGRFTVDFNGKKVFYQFDVNGGDVTFTSSVKQADVETLISGITVNGTDAKVTIDGKIKLGSVTLTSGALAVNSAESYIKELSINGGKTVVNGANIDALKANGGDTVINYVTADSLSVNINGSGSISIVTGEFGSTTCKTDSGYTLGMAIASGSVVFGNNINGFTVYTYEAIQTMTKTDRIFVDKCNHKDKNGSYVLDGNPCPYCNEEIVATVSYTADGGEMTDLFSDIYDAFAKANEAEKATVTLQKNITDDITDTIAVTGNVTLELNGKRLSQPGTDVWYSIEVTSGKLTVNGSGLIKRVAVCNGSNAEINGGTFSDFIIKDGGNAVIKGGQFYSLQVSGEGRNVGQLLADGYAYWSFIDSGIWSTIAEREKQDITNVEVRTAPIKSASIAWYGGGTPVVYRNGAKNLDVNITYELADTSKRITYSDFVNGNNRSKDSEFSDNWYTVFGYEIGDIITEDGEVEYYTVLKCDGYEYKSNVLKLTLATCSHPEDSFTEKNNDGGVFCGICDLLIGAQVIKADGEPLGYADIESAIKLAQENEGSTVKLISEGVSTSNTSITVTGGKFTVDFNGKEVYYNSDVKGGDVTFTSSVKQADAENLLSTIKVNGADAKVTIDGKIKLGMVRTFSGTLTVNSTDGYIGELSIEGAKTDVDGARIGALRTFGGEAVIKNVTADSLAMFDNRSGGSEYNVSIVSGMFGSFTCENGSNYTLGRAIASGSVVSADSMNGITVYTYEAIQTMTSTYRIFVDKCNHKDKNGSYVLDGNPCPYCNEEIVATVSYTAGGSEETDLFSDIYDAFAKANEIGTATVTLYKDITDDITDTIAVTGNVTLELNGKKLSTSGFDPYYAIEVKSGKLTVNGSGTIKCVVVRNGGDAEINGGIFSDFRIEDGGNAVINGGKFNSIKVSGEGRNVGQLLADGHAYKNFDGFWSTVAEREKQDIANVEVKEAPIKSATITANDESPIIYRNGKKAVTFAADVTYSGDKTLYITGCLIDGTVISEKTELLNGYSYLLGDQVDKVVAEDGEIQYYCIFTYDGYDYKSNVVTLTVATCRHPGESVKCDDNGCVCGICNRALPASVELSDGTLSYYENWNDAIGAAEESEGCTLKLLDYSGVNDGEIFDISKGRFTVDLNKNDGNTAFAFDVKGGDITFTASQEASSSLTGVTVSGENANVLIDSKATLNYLVVNSGKVSADGANIGAITINGGDTVINDVNADYLSMKADTTGGSGYNVSIVSGTFNIFTCENESNYTLGRAIASGSRVIGLNAIVGSGFKYAEIQSMTKANYLNVIKCDHKDANDSYVLDGNPCPYCNEEIAATVSYTADGGEMTDLFSDIYDAFDKANEAGTATVTLYKDITNSELTQGVTITGNVTLALNGKKLGGTFAFNAPVEVSDGGMFTVGGDGKMRMPIKAYANSKLIINGGEFTSVMVYIDGDAEIGGGVIDALTIIGNAKAKISGGKFYNIEIANGSLESVLADGYAYKKDGGAWLSIAERAESVYSSVNNDNKPVNVEEAPIKSATLSTEINKLYRNSNANPTLKFNLALAHGSNLNDSYVSKRYGINSYVSGDIIYSSLSALVKDAKLSADEIIDKAGNSVAAKIYFVVITDDGYEIKSNTVSIDLVDCDHSQVVDPTADKETAGNITEPTYCEICESKFNAKITKGDDVKYYNNLDEAAKDAQKSENEGCTLYPLYNKNGYGGQLVITEGNFTLKYAVRTAFSRPIIINGKAKLTVTGRCAVTEFENQDAFIVRGGDVTFDGLATGSNVTINGGNVTMTANNINCLTINGGNVSISSGGFAEIVTTVSDKVIADYIDHGFWVQDRGTKEWIDIYSLNKATASSTNGLTVRLCPMQIIKPIDTVYYTNGYYPDGIPSLQISAVPWYSGEVDAKVAYQWIAIDENGYETVIEGATDRKLSLENLTTGRYYCRLTYSNAATAGVSMKSDVVTATITECEHSGGEATCTEKAKCEICGAEYGEPLGHDYVVIKVVEPDYRNEGYSVFECTRCKDSYIGNRVPVKPIPDVEEIAVEKTTYNEVDISWKNISGVDGFNVECYVGDQWKQINCSADGDRVAAKLSGLSAGLKYKVRIAAYAGRFTGKFRCFYVDTVPSPVWNINTVKATDETVRISWSRNTRADGYKVEWYIDNQWSVKTVTGNNNIAAVIDGLCAGTRYKVRVSAYKGDLYSPYTYGYIDTLPSKVTGITQTVTSSSFTLKWDKNESADGYTVQYYADGKWNEKTLVGNKKTTVTIGSLKGYKTYKVRIKAYKGELESAFDDIYITTAPTKVDGLKVKSAVDSKAVVIWNADATADGYNVGYYIGGKWVEKAITDNKTAMAVLGGLTPYSTYKVRVRAYKDNLYGDYSYTTVTAVLSPVTNIKVVSAKSNSITVKWGKNTSADGYKVEIYTGGKWVKKTLKGSANATVTIGGLRAGSVYKVRIASYKGANTSAYTYANVNTAK